MSPQSTSLDLYSRTIFTFRAGGCSGSVLSEDGAVNGQEAEVPSPAWASLVPHHRPLFCLWACPLLVHSLTGPFKS